jgi:hypothetical protein
MAMTRDAENTKARDLVKRCSAARKELRARVDPDEYAVLIELARDTFLDLLRSGDNLHAALEDGMQSAPTELTRLALQAGVIEAVEAAARGEAK